MRVFILLMSVVTYVSGHNWYNGPYHYVIDIHRSVPRIRAGVPGSIMNLGTQLSFLVFHHLLLNGFNNQINIL